MAQNVYLYSGTYVGAIYISFFFISCLTLTNDIHSSTVVHGCETNEGMVFSNAVHYFETCVCLIF